MGIIIIANCHTFLCLFFSVECEGVHSPLLYAKTSQVVTLTLRVVKLFGVKIAVLSIVRKREETEK